MVFIVFLFFSGFLILCLVTGDVNLSYLMKTVSAESVLWKMTIFPFVVNVGMLKGILLNDVNPFYSQSFTY